MNNQHKLDRNTRLSLCLFTMLSLGGCKHEAESAPAAEPAANLKVETVHLQSVASWLELPGRVEADPAHLVHIYAPLSGRLMNFSLAAGQDVRKGPDHRDAAER